MGTGAELGQDPLPPTEDSSGNYTHQAENMLQASGSPGERGGARGGCQEEQNRPPDHLVGRGARRGFCSRRSRPIRITQSGCGKETSGHLTPAFKNMRGDSAAQWGSRTVDRSHGLQFCDALRKAMRPPPCSQPAAPLPGDNAKPSWCPRLLHAKWGPRPGAPAGSWELDRSAESRATRTYPRKSCI